MAAKHNDKNAIIITRVFNAPREQVWKLWTDPERLKQWWGPKGFTAPYSSINLHVGGKYLYAMRGPDGTDYWSTGTFREVVPPERIVCTDSFSDEEGNIVPASKYGLPGRWPREMLVTVEFRDEDGRTRMTLRHDGIPTEDMRSNTKSGWNQSFDKLAAALLAVPQASSGEGTTVLAEPGKQVVTLTRVFDAPRTVVFEAYVDPELIPRWWGPRRFTTIVDRMEVKPGGIWRFVHRDPDGREYRFHGVFHEILSPERIVSTFEFEAAPGHVSLETVTLEDLDGKTRVVDKAVFQSPEDRDAMLAEGMAEGAAETMDRLANLISELKKGKKAA